MEIKILGTGCKKCTALYESVVRALEEEGVEATVEKVEDIVGIMSYGVMSTPALVVDGKVVVSGRTLGTEEIKKYL